MGATAVAIVNPEFIAYFIAENARRSAETGPQIAYHIAGELYYASGTIWYNYHNARDISLDAAATTQIGLLTAQWVAYYDAADDAIDERDLKIDAQIAFMQTLEDLNVSQDLPMLNLKNTVLEDLELPDITPCTSGLTIRALSNWDGLAADGKSYQLGDEVCGDIPLDWALHDGLLQAAKTGGYIDGLAINADKRRVESFRTRKTDLVRQSQIAIKSVFNAGDTLAKYAQAASIHSGFVDLYVAGFNSAGAGLGVALGQLATGSGQTTNYGVGATATASAGSIGGSAIGTGG